MTFREQEVKNKSQIQFSHLSVPLIYHCLLCFTHFRVRNQWFLGLLESRATFEAHCQMLFATFWQLSRERSASTVPAWTTQGYNFRARPQRRPVSFILATHADLFLRTTKRWLVQLRKNLEEPGPRTSTLGWANPSQNWICSTVQEFTTAFCYYQLFKHVSEIKSTTIAMLILSF